MRPVQRERRYQTAGELAEDLRLRLAREPIRAKRDRRRSGGRYSRAVEKRSSAA